MNIKIDEKLRDFAREYSFSIIEKHGILTDSSTICAYFYRSDLIEVVQETFKTQIDEQYEKPKDIFLTNAGSQYVYFGNVLFNFNFIKPFLDSKVDFLVYMLENRTLLLLFNDFFVVIASMAEWTEDESKEQGDPFVKMPLIQFEKLLKLTYAELTAKAKEKGIDTSNRKKYYCKDKIIYQIYLLEKADVKKRKKQEGFEIQNGLLVNKKIMKALANYGEVERVNSLYHGYIVKPTNNQRSEALINYINQRSQWKKEGYFAEVIDKEKMVSGGEVIYKVNVSGFEERNADYEINKVIYPEHEEITDKKDRMNSIQKQKDSHAQYFMRIRVLNPNANWIAFTKRFKEYEREPNSSQKFFTFDIGEFKEKGVQGIAFIRGLPSFSASNTSKKIAWNEFRTQAIIIEYKKLGITSVASSRKKIEQALLKYEKDILSILSNEYGIKITKIAIVPKKNGKDFQLLTNPKLPVPKTYFSSP
jgi:hypothetical protein